jgi:histidinol-phosphate/aromatic aminotransferase/cobyric acid decarboxylase-like protein
VTGVLAARWNCNRPADALAVLWFTPPGQHVEAVCAVLRSWEERFAATLTALSPACITVVVGAPPTDQDEALRLAAKHHALAPAEDAGLPDALRDLARRLRGDDPRAAGSPGGFDGAERV